jgi:ATP-dependent DNA helicase RecG
MTDADTREIIQLLEDLLSGQVSEHAVFREAKTNFKFDDLGRYFSAISNETKLELRQYGWLVFGIDKDKKPTGTGYREGQDLNRLKKEIKQDTTGHLTLTNIYEVEYKGNRVILFEIPAAGLVPVAWKGTSYRIEDDAPTVLTGSFRQNRQKSSPIPAVGGSEQTVVKEAVDQHPQILPFGKKKRPEDKVTEENVAVPAETETAEPPKAVEPPEAKGSNGQWSKVLPFGRKKSSEDKVTEEKATAPSEVETAETVEVSPEAEEPPKAVEPPEAEDAGKPIGRILSRISKPHIRADANPDSIKSTDVDIPHEGVGERRRWVLPFGRRNRTADRDADVTRGNRLDDWSGRICSGATIGDLDKKAIAKARNIFTEKNAGRNAYSEMANVDDATFLRRLGLISGGSVTNAAMVLFSSADAAIKVSPAPEIAWMMRDKDGDVTAGQIFMGGLVFQVESAISQLRNPVCTYAVDKSSAAITEVPMYDMSVLREIIYNAIAHQDYALKGRINILEYENYLVVVNPGSFIPETVEKLLTGGYIQPYYRNHLLVMAMKNIGMMDTYGGGIVRTMKIQRDRYLPLPDYKLSDDSVSVKIYSAELDENFSSTLFQRPDLDILSVYLLDRVQKNEPITKEQADRLLSEKVVDGVWPQVHTVSSAPKMLDESEVIDDGQDDNTYEDYVISYIVKFGRASRSEVDDLIWNIFPDSMTDFERSVRIRNLLQKLSKAGKIENSGSRKYPKWVLTEEYKKQARRL